MTDRGPGRVGFDGRLGALCASWRDVQQTRLALAQRGLTEASAAMHVVEKSLAREVTKELRRRPIYAWLGQHPGVRGVHVARLVSIIGDALRFPGQPCTLGHIVPARYTVGDQCPAITRSGEEFVRCEGIVGPQRRGSGTRSVWHYLGLHAIDGHSPRKQKGQRADWNMEGRSAVLQPGGIAEQIVRLNVEPWVGIYRATKDRLTRERGIESLGGSETDAGPALTDGPEVDRTAEIVTNNGLRPIQIDHIARKVAAKQFVADLLAEMKRLAVETVAESVMALGRQPLPHADEDTA